MFLFLWPQLLPNTSGEGGAELLPPVMPHSYPPPAPADQPCGREGGLRGAGSRIWNSPSPSLRDLTIKSKGENQQVTVPVTAITSWQDVDF